MPSNHAHSSDAWDSHATKWSSAVQQITLTPCKKLLEDMEALTSFESKDVEVLDDGSGAGQVTGLIKSQYHDLPITAADISKGMVESTAKKARDEEWKNVKTIVQDAQDLDQLKDASFSHVLCTFVISFTENPEKAMAEMYRVLRSDGAVGIATWDEVSWVECWVKAVRAVQGNEEYSAPRLFHAGTMSTEWMEMTMQKVGFTEVKVEPFKCYHPPTSVDDAVELFYTMENPSTKLLMKGFDEDFIRSTRKYFTEAYDEKYAGGQERQYEVAILATGKKSL